MLSLQIQNSRTARRLTATLVVLLASVASAQITYPNPINHVIIVYQENRSLDNLFGSNAPANQYYLPGLVVSTTGQAYTITDGKKKVFTVTAVPLPLASTVGSAGSILADDYDLGHSHQNWGTNCDAPLITDPSTDCAMDGFNQVKVICDAGATGCPGPKYPQYGYVQYSDVAPYFQIAAQYSYANYMFQTNQGPSLPAHQFIFGGTSQPGNGPEPDWFVANNAAGTDTINGCIAPAGATVALVNPTTQDVKTNMYPCFNHETMADVFAAASPKITWTYYTTADYKSPGDTIPDGSLWTAPNSIQAICTPDGNKCTGEYWTKGESNGYVDDNPSHVLSDIANCNLKQVSWVIPDALESDHSGSTDGSGPSWVASIVNAVGTQPKCKDGEVYWNNTVILITWDDWGGWYEHVVPPAVNAKAPAGTSSYVYGFRVPLMVVSAYTPAGTVSNTMGLDFGAILKFTEQIFNLGNIPPGNYADYYANDDLGEFFQFTKPPRSFQSITAPLGAEVFLDPKRPMGPPDND
jgi:phospholipase C